MSETAILSHETDTRPVGRMALLAEFWAYFSENRGAVYGLFFFIAIVMIAVFISKVLF